MKVIFEVSKYMKAVFFHQLLYTKLPGHCALVQSSKINLFTATRNFVTIREIQPRAFKFYMEQRVDNLLKAANERFERKHQLELEMQNFNFSEQERGNFRQLLRKKETNHLRLIRAKLSKAQFDIIKVLGKVNRFILR